VIRSAGSKTKVDLVAIKTGELLLIQCKLPISDLPTGEWNRLRELSRMCGARSILALKVSGSAHPFYREIWTDAPAGRRRDLGVHWGVWSPDPLGES
jgi:Holliday junction resolvase